MRKLENKTRKDVHHYYTQIQHMKLSGSILYDANYVYFDKWEKMNQSMVNLLNTELGKMDLKYFKHEELGEGMIRFHTDEKGEYILNEPLTREQWKEEYDTLLDVPSIMYV